MKLYPCDELDENICGRSRRDLSSRVTRYSCGRVSLRGAWNRSTSARGYDNERCKTLQGRRQETVRRGVTAARMARWVESCASFTKFRYNGWNLCNTTYTPFTVSPFYSFPKDHSIQKVLTIKTRRNGNLKTMGTPPLCFWKTFL